MKKQVITGLLASVFLISAFSPMDVVATSQVVEQATLSTSPESDFGFSDGTILSYQGGGGNIVIPSTINGQAVTKIGANAFEYNKTITGITIPDSVTEIGYRAFMACSTMTYLKLGNGVQILGQQSFWNCDSLTKISIPNSVKSIGDRTFETCDKLNSVTFGHGLISLGASAFGACPSLTQITLPNALESIGTQAFALCNGLKTLFIPTSVTSIGENLLSYYDQSQGFIHVEATIHGEGGTVAHQYAKANGIPFVADPKIATPSTAKVMVNGTLIPFGAYTIDGFNYFKLTDLSYALNGTSRQFQVTWDPEKSSINMTTSLPHIVLNTELQGNSGQNETAEGFLSDVYQDGQAIPVTVYTINGSSYFKLDALKQTLDLNVGWDGATGTITITA